LQKYITISDIDYPKDLIEKVVAQREESTPKLLEIAEKFFTYSHRDITYEQWREAMVAFFILSKFREQKAFQLVVRLCKFPYKSVNTIFGDITTENLPEFLASTFNGDWQELYSIIANQHFEEYSRLSVIDAYGILYMHNIMSREQIIEIFSKLFDELYDDFSCAPTFLVCKCNDICAVELFDKIEKYFEKNVVDDSFIGLKEIKKSFSVSLEEALEEMRNRPVHDFIDDLQKDMGWLFGKDEDDLDSECEDDKKEDDVVKF
jgi:hypothetical protein